MLLSMISSVLFSTCLQIKPMIHPTLNIDNYPQVLLADANLLGKCRFLAFFNLTIDTKALKYSHCLKTNISYFSRFCRCGARE